jgi:hypothetical protein
MKVTYSAVRDWLDSRAGAECTVAELEQLAPLILVAAEQARAIEARRAEALARATAVAKEFGFESLDALRGDTGGARAEPAAGSRREQISSVRKPHLDPTDASANRLYALTKHKILPPWAQRLIDAGWSMDELSYRNHAEALQRRGLPQLYDAVQRHRDLLAQETPRPRK